MPSIVTWPHSEQSNLSFACLMKSRITQLPALASIVALFLLALGCDQKSAEDSFQSKRDAMWARVNAKSDAEQAAKRKIVVEEARTMLPATSKENLAKAYQLAFDGGDITAMEQMAVFRGDIDDGLKKRFLEVNLGTLRAGESHITNHSFEPLTDGDHYRYSDQNVESMLAIDTRANDDSGSSSSKLAVISEGESSYFLFYYAKPDPEIGTR